MKVPFIDLKRYENGFLDRWQEKVMSMTVNAEFIGGGEVARLEGRLKDVTEQSNAISCANGTDALQLALRAMGVGAKDVVLVPNFTFWATFEAVVNVGADPVTVDASLADGGVDFDVFEKALDEIRPKVAIIAHLYGWGAQRLHDIRELCRRKGVMLLEDGAQCFGARYGDESIYKSAYVSTISFYPAKVLGAAGDGGAVVTSDVGLAEKIRRLGNHGRTAHYGYGDVGWNSRMDAFQAAFVNLSLDHLAVRIESRCKSAAYYQAHLSTVSGFRVMSAPSGYTQNGYCNVCMVKDPARKAAIEAALKMNNIGFGNIYPGAMSEQEGAKPYLKSHVGGRHTQELCTSVLNLPLFPYMVEAELCHVVETVRQCQL